MRVVLGQGLVYFIVLHKKCFSIFYVLRLIFIPDPVYVFSALEQPVNLMLFKSAMQSCFMAEDMFVTLSTLVPNPMD